MSSNTRTTGPRAFAKKRLESKRQQAPKRAARTKRAPPPPPTPPRRAVQREPPPRAIPRAMTGPLAIPGRPSHFKSAHGRNIERHPVHGVVERVWGHDHVAMVVVPSSEVTGSIYVNVQIGAGQAGGSSEAPANTHKRWVPNHIEYQFISSLGNDATGTYLTVVDPDPIAPWVSGATSNVARLSASTGAVFKQVSQHDTTKLPTSRDYTSLWCADTTPTERTDADRLTYAGQYMMLCAVPTGKASGTVIGMVRRWYDISYIIDTVGESAATRTSEFKLSGDAAARVFAATRAASPTRKGIIDAVIAEIKNNADQYVSFGGAVGALRRYNPLSYVQTTDANGEISIVPSDVVNTGWPEGHYTVSIAMATGDIGAGWAYPLYANKGYIQDLSYHEGTSDQFAGSVSAGSFIYDGELYPKTSIIELSFGVDSSTRGFIDHMLTYWESDPEADFSKLIYIVRIKTVGNDFYSTSTASAVTAKARPRNGEQSSQYSLAGVKPVKLERKTAISDPPPPRMGSGPSAVPGGSLYSPRSYLLPAGTPREPERAGGAAVLVKTPSHK